MDQYKGEAHAIRALAYFTIVRYFARPFTDNPDGMGVPIVLVYDPEYKPGRSKVNNASAKTATLDVINNGGFSPLTAANHAAYWASAAVRTNPV